MSILAEIIEEKKKEIADIIPAERYSDLRRRGLAAPPPQGFVRALLEKKKPAIIAEIKRGSPSKGIIRADLEPEETALAFARNGAACLSVLTDQKFFLGDLSFIARIKQAFENKQLSPIPILRKDFIIHPAQVWQTRVCGADAGLLIVAALEPDQLRKLLLSFLESGLDLLLEVHSAPELDIALAALADCWPGFGRAPSVPEETARLLLGINNRDLKTFVTDLKVTRELIEQLDSKGCIGRTPVERLPIVSESGIFTADDLRRLDAFGAQGFLIGESLVAKGEPGENLARLIADFGRHQ